MVLVSGQCMQLMCTQALVGIPAALLSCTWIRAKKDWIERLLHAIVWMSAS